MKKEVVVCASDCFARRVIALSFAGLGCRVVELSASASSVESCCGGRVVLVVMLGVSEALGPLLHLRRREPAGRKPELWLLSWHHSAAVTTTLLERGVTQTMTFPCSLRRLRRKAEALLKTVVP